MAINEDTPTGLTTSQIPFQNNKPSLSDYPIHAIRKINPKTQKPALYYMTVCTPRHKIGFCMDLVHRPLNSASALNTPSPSFQKQSVDNLKPIPNTVNSTNNDYTKFCSKDNATNMAILLNFFKDNIHQSFTKYPSAQMVYDRLVGSLDKNCLSDDDLAIVKALAEEDSITNKELVAEKVKNYMFNILLESSFPEEIAKSVAELMMSQVVDLFFRDGNCI